MELKEKNNKFLILIIIFIIVISALFFTVNKNKNVKLNEYRLTEYETKLIDYFKEIALKVEFGENINKVIKWKKPMILYVEGNKLHNQQINAIKKTIKTINQLVSDGFYIELTRNKNNSNAILYLIDKKNIDKTKFDFYDKIKEDFVGLTEIEINDNYNIIDAKIFINANAPIDIQESVILEEITQSIGLMNDSNKYPNSIFYQKQDERKQMIKEYSQLDKDIIKLLYNPKMKAGFDSMQAEKFIKKILSKEKP